MAILTPVSYFQPRDTIVLDYIGSADSGAGVADGPDHEGNSDVGEDNSIPLSLGEQNRVSCTIAEDK